MQLFAFVTNSLQEASGLGPLLFQKLAMSLAIVAMLLFISQGSPVDPQKSVK